VGGNITTVKRNISPLIIFSTVTVIFWFFPASCTKNGKDEIKASGTIEGTQVDVAAQVAGQLRELRVDEGSIVKVNDTMAILDKVVAEASLSQAQANFNNAQADERRITALFASGSATPKQKDDADARLVLTKAALALAQKAVNDCYITSPINGTVTNKVMEVGDLATPGSIVVTVTRLDTVILTIYVSEVELGRLKLGASAEVTTDASRKLVLPGKIVFISPVAEFTPKNIQTREDRVKLVFAVKVEIPNPDGILKPGMPADATIKAPPVSTKTGTQN
jgi:membrane fusion protein YbhG